MKAAVLFARKDSVYKTMENCDDEERAKVAAYKAAWRVKNAERLKAKDAAYRAANRERLIAQQAKWYAENKERAHESQRKWNAANPERSKAIKRKYHEAHPEKPRIYAHNRRARMRENGGEFSRDIVPRLFKLQKGKCACCGVALGKNYQLDHIVPVALGGANIDSNAQLLTERCNKQKHATDPITFMQSKGRLL